MFLILLYNFYYYFRYGHPGVEFYGQHESESNVRKILFLPGQGRLVTLTEDNHLHLWEINGTLLQVCFSSIYHSLFSILKFTKKSAIREAILFESNNEILIPLMAYCWWMKNQLINIIIWILHYFCIFSSLQWSVGFQRLPNAQVQMNLGNMYF